MRTGIVAAIAAAMLAVGVLVGAAGAIVVRDATTPTQASLYAQMAAMHGSMGTHMDGMADMMGGSFMGPGSGLHGQHHTNAR